ncbi:hypothetical protein BJ508DRAFT_322204 [Ascobolus immersus RN42]|uniref:F-box domain-containing protein n=1 Tax=Ascobolus immersus RN42 TaxID=1160509 RepID=A0A3N4IIT9_ASCIM|nr:hypothetical protein BJ508DRAFT_322204 [Ascobolus immersus RN42]
MSSGRRQFQLTFLTLPLELRDLIYERCRILSLLSLTHTSRRCYSEINSRPELFHGEDWHNLPPTQTQFRPLTLPNLLKYGQNVCRYGFTPQEADNFHRWVFQGRLLVRNDNIPLWRCCFVCGLVIVSRRRVREHARDYCEDCACFKMREREVDLSGLGGVKGM